MTAPQWGKTEAGGPLGIQGIPANTPTRVPAESGDLTAWLRRTVHSDCTLDNLCSSCQQRFDAADLIERLERWKAEATQCMNEWEEVAALFEVRPRYLGKTKAAMVAAEIEVLRSIVDVKDQEILKAHAEPQEVAEAIVNSHAFVWNRGGGFQDGGNDWVIDGSMSLPGHFADRLSALLEAAEE